MFKLDIGNVLHAHGHINEWKRRTGKKLILNDQQTNEYEMNTKKKW